MYFTLTKIWQMSSLKQDQFYVYILKHSWITIIKVRNVYFHVYSKKGGWVKRLNEEYCDVLRKLQNKTTMEAFQGVQKHW